MCEKDGVKRVLKKLAGLSQGKNLNVAAACRVSACTKNNTIGNLADISTSELFKDHSQHDHHTNDCSSNWGRKFIEIYSRIHIWANQHF